MSLSVIVTAAGSSRRMGGVNKLLLELAGKPVLVRTLERFAALNFVESIVITAPKHLIEDYKKLCRDYEIEKVCAVIEGGKERQDSIFAALNVLKNTGCRYVAVHDAARPLVSERLISNLYLGLLRRNSSLGNVSKVIEDMSYENWLLLEEALEQGTELDYNSLSELGFVGKDKKVTSCEDYDIAGVIPGVAVKDTIKRVDKNGIVIETLVRAELQAVQTPQIFDYKTLMKAYLKAFEEGFMGTDDASLVERMGLRVLVMPGEYTNLKITTVDDVSIAAQLLEELEHV